MLERDFIIVNKLGLHARPSAMLVKAASRFESEITIERDGIKVNGKSIMGIMMLAAARGTTIHLSIDGPDQELAMESLGELLTNGFGED